jgi:NADH-quinone oxidoreductase subunit J
MNLVVFFVIAIVAVLGGAGMVLSGNPVHSALFLIVNLFCVAVLYLSLNAEFLAVVQVIVYAGAIMVLFLFVITLLNPLRGQTAGPLDSQGWLAGALALLLLAETAAFIGTGLGSINLPATPPAVDWAGDNVHAIGALLYSQYLFPFEVTSILLLVAIVGATVLAKRRI